jgi:hypothetical protein
MPPIVAEAGDELITGDCFANLDLQINDTWSTRNSRMTLYFYK